MQVGRSGWAPPLAVVEGLKGTADLPALARDLAASQQADGGWKAAPDEATTDRDTSVLHHVALATYLRRAAHAQAFKNKYTKAEHGRFSPDETTLKALEASLARSWQHLTGSTPSDPSTLLGPLPRSQVLARVSQAPAAFHEALLGDDLATRLEPAKVLQQAVELTGSGLRGEALPPQPLRVNWKALAGVACAGAAAWLALQFPGVALGVAEVAAGMGAGWLVSSFNESVVHDKIAHTKDIPGTRPIGAEGPHTLVGKVYEKSPEWLQENIYGTWFGHTKIHHYRTFTQDHVTQFKSPQEEEKLDAYLLKEGREDLIDSEHGVSLTWKGYLTFQAVASPSYALALGGAFLLGAGPLFAAGFALPAAAYPLFSKDYHRYTHMPAQKALDRASLPMKLFLQSDLSRFNVRRHFVHHREPEVNFNLMPGADWLRGKAQKPSVAQEEELRRLGVLW